MGSRDRVGAHDGEGDKARNLYISLYIYLSIYPFIYIGLGICIYIGVGERDRVVAHDEEGDEARNPQRHCWKNTQVDFLNGSSDDQGTPSIFWSFRSFHAYLRGREPIVAKRTKQAKLRGFEVEGPRRRARREGTRGSQPLRTLDGQTLRGRGRRRARRRAR